MSRQKDKKGLTLVENTNTKKRVTPAHHDLKKRQVNREAEVPDNIRDISEARRNKNKGTGQRQKSNGPKRFNGSPEHKRTKQASKLGEKVVLGNKLIGVVGLILIAGIIYLLFMRPNAYRIMVGNKEVATISMSPAIGVETFEEQIRARLENVLGTGVALKEEITFRPTNARERDRVTPEQALDRAAEVATYLIEAGEIYLNGEYIATVASVNGANAIIEDIAREWLPSNANILSIDAEGLSIRPTFIDGEDIADLHGVSAILRSSSREITTYRVVEGDSFWLIANRFGMTLDYLSELNGGLDVNNTAIRQGDVLMVSMDVPFLTIHTEEELEIITDIEPETEHSNNPNQPVGFSSVIRAGVPGQVREVYHVKRTNGIETDRVHIATENLTEPVSYLIEIGTGE